VAKERRAAYWWYAVTSVCVREARLTGHCAIGHPTVTVLPGFDREVYPVQLGVYRSSFTCSWPESPQLKDRARTRRVDVSRYICPY